MINLSTPANPRLLRLASEFLTAAALAIEEGCLGETTYQSETVSIGDVSHTKTTTGTVNIHVDPRSVMEIVQDLEDGFAGIPEDDEFSGALADEVENEAAEAFAPEVPPPPAAVVPPPPKAEPVYETVYTMTDLAKGFSRESHHERGWTDDLMVQHGIMTVSQVEVTPPPLADAPPAAPAPMPTPAPSAPPPSSNTQPVASPAGTTLTVVVDIDGRPWDARIDSGEKTKTADGRWKIKRGTDKDLVARVKAELKQLSGNVSPPAATQTKVAPPATQAGVIGGNISACAALMRRITPAVLGGQFTQADVLAAVVAQGLTAVKDLNLPENVAACAAVERALFGGAK